MTALSYYLAASYRRKRVDADLCRMKGYLSGRVLDVGGARRRGRFRPPPGAAWIVADIARSLHPDVVADVQCLPFRDGIFNAVKATEIFEHVPDPAAALAECRRVLATGGHLIATVPFLERVHGDPDDYVRYTEAMWRRLLATARLETITIAPQGGYFSHLAGLLRFLVLHAPWGLRHVGYLTFPVLDLVATIDEWPRLADSGFAAFVGGYLIVATRRV